jgi:hypothetical protein
MKLVGGGSNPNGVTFHDDPDAIRVLEGITWIESDCARWTGAAPEPGLPAGLGDGPCGHPTGPVEPQSSTQIEELPVGA